uniref:DB module n=1 Tax=Onchocerca flexuosa TaxID=387005 RepID=A0A183H7W8_9BILA
LNFQTQIIGTESPEEHTTFLYDYQVPCAAFTDKICIEQVTKHFLSANLKHIDECMLHKSILIIQKKRLGADKMSKCCDKGIYLTDLCMPGHCTNATTEFKAINTAGDAFSRCCYHKFIEDDDKCCPARRAKFHWLTAYEICLPNVRVDLSDVRFSMRVASSNDDTKKMNQESNEVVTVDLNADRSWDHSCEQGAKVFQFPYLPVDELAKVKVDNENSEEGR